jgi:dTDP-4-dehydrorhamnose 3,5-epimerase-like enzyme
MKLTALETGGAQLAESHRWSDDRGFFAEWIESAEVHASTEHDFSIKQVNIRQGKSELIHGILYS